jgi:hypothetical protein
MDMQWTPTPEERKRKYDDFVNYKLKSSPFLEKAVEIFLTKKGILTLDEFKNILLNIYYASRTEIMEEIEEMEEWHNA